MTTSDEILILANQIANKGNKPTVALIKTKLNKKVPLPLVISTLRNWQHEPNFISLPEDKHDMTKTTNTSNTEKAFEQELCDELVEIKKELFELKHLVKQLIDQQKN